MANVSGLLNFQLMGEKKSRGNMDIQIFARKQNLENMEIQDRSSFDNNGLNNPSATSKPQLGEDSFHSDIILPAHL